MELANEKLFEMQTKLESLLQDSAVALLNLLASFTQPQKFDHSLKLQASFCNLQCSAEDECLLGEFVKKLCGAMSAVVTAVPHPHTVQLQKDFCDKALGQYFT